MLLCQSFLGMQRAEVQQIDQACSTGSFIDTRSCTKQLNSFYIQKYNCVFQLYNRQTINSRPELPVLQTSSVKSPHMVRRPVSVQLLLLHSKIKICGYVALSLFGSAVLNLSTIQRKDDTPAHTAYKQGYPWMTYKFCLSISEHTRHSTLSLFSYKIDLFIVSQLFLCVILPCTQTCIYGDNICLWLFNTLWQKPMF